MTQLDDALEGVTRLGFDTSPIIFFVERDARYIDLVREVFRRVDMGTITGHTGMISLAEVLVKPRRLGDTALEKSYRDVLTRSRNFSTRPIETAVAGRAADLRVRYRLKLPDALQIASALEAGCEAILTGDGDDFRQATDLRVLILKDLQL